jgi:hypothetical protein
MESAAQIDWDVDVHVPPGFLEDLVVLEAASVFRHLVVVNAMAAVRSLLTGARQQTFRVEARLRAVGRTLPGSTDPMRPTETPRTNSPALHTASVSRNSLCRPLRTWLTYNRPSGSSAMPGTHLRWQIRLGLLTISMRTLRRNASANTCSFKKA